MESSNVTGLAEVILTSVRSSEDTSLRIMRIDVGRLVPRSLEKGFQDRHSLLLCGFLCVICHLVLLRDDRIGPATGH